MSCPLDLSVFPGRAKGGLEALMLQMLAVARGAASSLFVGPSGLLLPGLFFSFFVGFRAPAAGYSGRSLPNSQIELRPPC